MQISKNTDCTAGSTSESWDDAEILYINLWIYHHTHRILIIHFHQLLIVSAEYTLRIIR